MADQPGPLDREMREPLPSLLDAEQVELFRDHAPGRDAAVAVEVARRTGPGRRPGSLNRRNQRLRDFILARYRHPAIELAETYSRPVEVLAAELGCTAIEAKKLQQDAAAELLPYLEQKLAAVSVKVETEDVVLVMGGPGATPAELKDLRDKIAAEGVETVALEMGWGDNPAGDIEGDGYAAEADVSKG